MSTPDDVGPVVVEMGGDNIVVRPPAGATHWHATSLAELVNAATRTSTIVVVDPAPLRCDDAFATYVSSDADRTCREHGRCAPSEAVVVTEGVVHVRTEGGVWLIDLRDSRLARTDARVDPQFVAGAAWTPIVAVRIAPTRVTALGPDGSLTSAPRDHLATAA
jgi:hypothetical protein